MRAYPVSALVVDQATGKAVAVGQGYGNGEYTVSGPASMQNVGTLLDGDAATYSSSAAANYDSAGAYTKSTYLAEPTYPGEWVQIVLPAHLRLSHIAITKATGRPNSEAPKNYKVYGYAPTKQPGTQADSGVVP